MEVINSEELKFLSVYDSNYMGHSNFALLQLSNDVAHKVLHNKVAIPLKIAETESNHINPYFEEGIYIYIYKYIYIYILVSSGVNSPITIIHLLFI